MPTYLRNIDNVGDNFKKHIMILISDNIEKLCASQRNEIENVVSTLIVEDAMTEYLHWENKQTSPQRII